MIYFVTFHTQKNCVIWDMIFHCRAKNAKDACVIAKQEWTGRGHKEHQFHLYAHKSNIQDDGLLAVRSWKNNEWRGDDVMNRFIATSYRIWKRD